MARLCAVNAVAMARGEVPPHPVNPEAWTRVTILVAPDSFKGTYTAAEVAEHISTGIEAVGATGDPPAGRRRW